MNLYIWEGEGVLQDYTSGMIVALANNLDEAHNLINPESYGNSNYPKMPSETIYLGDISVQPRAFLCWGGS